MGISFSYGPSPDRKEMIPLIRKAAASKIEIDGARYPESAAKLVGR